MFRLAHYMSKDGNEHFGKSEYVVILQDGEKPEDYADDIFEVGDVLEIDGDATSMPCSRELTA